MYLYCGFLLFTMLVTDCELNRRMHSPYMTWIYGFSKFRDIWHQFCSSELLFSTVCLREVQSLFILTPFYTLRLLHGIKLPLHIGYILFGQFISLQNTGQVSFSYFHILFFYHPWLFSLRKFIQATNFDCSRKIFTFGNVYLVILLANGRQTFSLWRIYLAQKSREQAS